MAEESDDYVTLGKVIGFFGVRGWVKVHSDTEPRENIVTYSRWWLGSAKQRQAVEVASGKRSGKNVIAKIAGIDTREQAELYIGKQIAVPRSMLPSLGNDEFYWTDLIGCEVVDLQGAVIGSVKRLFETGANDVMVVSDGRADAGSKSEDILIPWVRPSVIVTVEVSERRIVVDWDPDCL